MNQPTIWTKDGRVFILDQTRLPLEKIEQELVTVEDMWDAIRRLQVRGAPAIGIAAAFGVWLAVRELRGASKEVTANEILRACEYLATARPTAVNLFHALNRIKALLDEPEIPTGDALRERVYEEAKRMIEEDNEICLALGRHGASLLKSGDRVLTHCNAGGLATARYGTALAAVYYAVHHEGKHIEVFADETRPLLQGARLTAWELMENGVPVTLICDNMAATVMQRGWVDAVIVGTDRTVRNGDVANKIGTYGLALLARAHGIPFYVSAPTSSIDLSLEDGSQIPIEERPAEEITTIASHRLAPHGVRVFNPAFDVTPNHLVTAIITERGIVRPPYCQTIPALFGGAVTPSSSATIPCDKAE